MPTLPRLETLFDRAAGSAVLLPPELREAYGGELRFAESDRPHVFANFVSTLDGLVSYGVPGVESARFISRGHAADRFVMGLLRASADALISGSGTLRAEPQLTWTPKQVFPAAADLYAQVRRARGLPERARVAVLSATGELDPSLPVFRTDDVEAIVVTSRAGGVRLAPSGLRVLAIGEREPGLRQAIDAVAQAFGARLILSEAGPTLFGKMLDERVVDELFVTLAPQLAGRSADRPGLALVEGLAFDHQRAPWGSLVAAKRADDHLLLRYAFA